MSERSEIQVHRSGVRPTEPPKRLFRPESEVKAEALLAAVEAIKSDPGSEWLPDSPEWSAGYEAARKDMADVVAAMADEVSGG